ncbi:MAG: hypothetical protein IPP90_20750 [Gemmatimonadaceae bacterium]|nr:hypothetical protein [Gemmatimonadaceae bacterium]
MMPLANAACAVLMSLNALTADSAKKAPPLSIDPDATRPVPHLTFVADTVRKPRTKAFVYSDGYDLRLTWHKRLSWGMMPLFAASYFSGDQLFKKGSAAPGWARSIHGPSATGSAILFSAQTLTGGLNLWEGRKNPSGRTRRILHSVLFTTASAGFVYAGTRLADDAEQSQSQRTQHKNVALASMGVSTFSWLIMLVGN